MVDLTAFRGPPGWCRIVSLVAGFLLFGTVIVEQFHMAGVTQAPFGYVPSITWFNLFSFLIVMLYFVQVAWTAILIRTGQDSGIDKRTIIRLDGGLNGTIGGVVLLICFWWVGLLLFTFWEIVGSVHCPPNGRCLPKIQFGFSVAMWIFAAFQGVASTVMGFLMYRHVFKVNDDSTEGVDSERAKPESGLSTSTPQDSQSIQSTTPA